VRRLCPEFAVRVGRESIFNFNEVSHMAKVQTPGILMLMSCFLACAQQPKAPSVPESVEDALRYILGPDDQVKVWVLGLEEITDKPLRIDPGGDIDLPLIGKVHAGGLTVEQLKAELVQRFSKELLKPQVSVEIVDFGSQPVSVMGAVNHPGVYQLHGRRTLMEAVSLADGLRQDAGPRITISRQIQYGPIPLRTVKTDSSGKFSVAEVSVKELLAGTNPTENIPVCPNDVVAVPLAEAVYVIGEVKKPGEIALKNNASISVLQALASAEGYGATPAPQDSKIIRLVPGSTERKEIPVDLRKIQAGKAEDIAMRPDDILVIPPSGPKKAAARAVEAAIQTATGIVIWRRP
jgi:polysaccharide export outer membrane protein